MTTMRSVAFTTRLKAARMAKTVKAPYKYRRINNYRRTSLVIFNFLKNDCTPDEAEGVYPSEYILSCFCDYHPWLYSVEALFK